MNYLLVGLTFMFVVLAVLLLVDQLLIWAELKQLRDKENRVGEYGRKVSKG